MSAVLNKSIERVERVLVENNVSSNIVELSSGARTAQEAASLLGCSVAQIIKSLLFRTFLTRQPILVLASGANRVEEKIISLCIGETIVKADANFVREKTGFAIGGVAPVGHVEHIEHVFIDEDVLRFDVLWAAAGTPHAVFKLTPLELQTLTRGKVISVR